jgi:hypothetical protein
MSRLAGRLSSLLALAAQSARRSALTRSAGLALEVRDALVRGRGFPRETLNAGSRAATGCMQRTNVGMLVGSAGRSAAGRHSLPDRDDLPCLNSSFVSLSRPALMIALKFAVIGVMGIAWSPQVRPLWLRAPYRRGRREPRRPSLLPTNVAREDCSTLSQLHGMQQHPQPPAAL